MSGGGGSESTPFLSNRPIFYVVLTLQVLDRLLGHLKKRNSRSSEQIQLRQEIKQLLREANSLSTPSTFAQAVKLRRQAAAKEKELVKSQQLSLNKNKWCYDMFGRTLVIAKVVIYLVFSWQFWGVPVVVAPPQLLQPFGRMLSWSTADPLTGLIPVGIVPWLVLTSQVSSFLCQKFSKLLHL